MSTPNGPASTNPPRRRGDGLGNWPYLLIAGGVLLLLFNFGGFGFGTVWSALNLWPVVVIAFGVDLITSGRYRRPIIVAAVVVGAAWWATDLRGGGGGGERVDVAHVLDGARAAEVVLRSGVGTVTVDASASRGDLLTGVIRAGRGETIAERASRVGNTARLEIASQASGPASVTAADPRSWTLALTREVPVDLRLHAGVGRHTLDLRAATLSALSVAGGVGETVVTLSDSGGYRADLDLGVGATTVRLPQSVEARVTVRSGLGRVNVDGGFERVGDVYTTSGFASASASDRVDVVIQGGVGAVTVQRVR